MMRRKKNKKKEIGKHEGEKKSKLRQPSSRVFSLVVDKAAFIDKIVLSIDGELKPNFNAEFQDPKSHGVSTPDSLYSRLVSGKFWPSGNPVDLLYGRKKRFANVPTQRITINSERIPITAAQVMLLVKRLTVESPQIRVSSLEFTFDVTGATIDYVLPHIIHRARSGVRVLSDGKSMTVYVGSPRSAWEVCIYPKPYSPVLRFEFRLRRPFLSRHGIIQPEDVLLLRKLKVWDLFSVRRFSAGNAARITRTWGNAVGKELIRTWGYYRRPLLSLPKVLKHYGVHPHQVLRRTSLQRKLEAMQKRFLW
jgi:hypothetical protein